MPKKANKAKRPKDKYYNLAKEQGYRARSAFKLIQLNKKYDFLAGATSIIDLCAAPGGWLQVAAKYMPTGSTIIGVDLMPIKPIRGVITHQEDITTPQCRTVLKRDLGGKLADVVLHDGAPNVGQNWNKDAFTQSELTLASLKLATEFLRPHGMFITKVFRSVDYNSLLWVFHQLFGKVEATKPHSSRNASAEIFVVCRDFKAPDKIDPKLLDPRFVFKETDDITGTAQGVAGGGGGKSLTVLDRKASQHNKRLREGYDEALGPLLTRRVPVCDFLRSDNPVRVLTDASGLDFDAEAAAAGVTTHAATTGEVVSCCADLKVLGKKEFKNLLRWRWAMRRAFPDAVGDGAAGAAGGDGSDGSGGDGSGSDGSDADSDAEDMRELSAAARAELTRRKRERKKAAKVREKASRRQKLGLNLRSVDLLDTDDTLFNLTALTKLAARAGGDAAMDAVRDVDLDDDAAVAAGAGAALLAGDDDGDDDGAAVPRRRGVGGAAVDDATAAALRVGGGVPVVEQLRAAAAASRLEEMEEDMERAYATFLAKRTSREAEHAAAVAEGKGPSKGIKLTRMQKLRQQAVMTEAALAGQLDVEHQKYLRLLAGARAGAEASALPLPPQLAGSKRGRTAAADADAAADDDDDGGDSSSGDSDADTADGEGWVAGGAGDARAARWFANPAISKALGGGAGLEEDADDDAAGGDDDDAGSYQDEVTDSEDEAVAAPPPKRRGAAAAAAATAPAAAPAAAAAAGRKRGGAGGSDDEDGQVGWLTGMPKSDRDKRKDKLRKLREKEAAQRDRAHKEHIQLVAGMGGAEDDADAEFERVTRMAAGGGGGGGGDDGGDSDDSSAAAAASRRDMIRRGMGRMAPAAVLAPGAGGKDAADAGFEVVPAAAGGAGRRRRGDASDNDSDDDSDDDSEASSVDPRLAQYDPDTHAEMLALGKALRRHTSAKALVDASYNRYAFDDVDLPPWFEEDEARHFKPQLPVSREDVERLRAQFRDIAARPVAKVAEARARKRRRVEVQYEKAKRRAESVLESEELQGRSREKALAKLHKAKAARRAAPIAIVASKSGKHGKNSSDARHKGGNVRLVDSRQKKDMRAMKRAARKRSGGGRRK